MVIRNRIPSTIKPEITSTSLVRCINLLILLPAHFFPAAHVGNALLIARHHYFGVARNFFAGLGAHRRRTTRSGTRINQLTRSTGADRTSDAPQHADHVVVGWIEI